MATLYRLYRPQKFAEVMGQDHITKTLKRAISSKRLTHAYLFHGPRGTGKTTTARILAKSINCTGAGGAEPCGKCAACKAAVEGRNIDIIEIDAASNRGIDDIRALRENVASAPTMGAYKVYIIDEVHMLTKEASAALLKTLEEPVEHVVFILATTELHKVPETIISRCQVYRFRRATDEELTARLKLLLKKEKRQAETEALEFIISRSDGCFRDAESLLGQLLTLQPGKVKVSDLTTLLGLPPQQTLEDLLEALLNNDAAAAVTVVDKAFADGYDPEQLINEAIWMCRTGALSALQGETALFTFAKHPEVVAKAPDILRALVQARQDLAFVPQPLIALHLAILTLTAKGTATNQISNQAATKNKNTKQTRVVIPIRQSVVTPRETKSKSEPIPSSNSEAVVSVAEIKQAWPKLIEAIRNNNPVTSTFLRAMEAVAVEGDVIRVKANYALHRNYFEKRENKLPIEHELSKLLKIPVHVRCFLDETGSLSPKAAIAKRKKQEDNLLANVKEIFGAESA